MRPASVLFVVACLVPCPGAAQAPLDASLKAGVQEAIALSPTAAEEILASADAALYLPSEGRLRWLSPRGAPAVRVLTGVALPDETLAGFAASLERDFPGFRRDSFGSYLLKLPVKRSSEEILKLSVAPVVEAVAAPFHEDFETNLSAWTLSSDTLGLFDWAITKCQAHSGLQSADAVRIGEVGYFLSCTDPYPATVNTSMLHTACEGLAGASAAWLDVWLTAALDGSDGLTFYYQSDSDGKQYGYSFTGSWAGWTHVVFNLKEWYGIGDVTALGCPRLVVSFSSAAGTKTGFGARIDDLTIGTDTPSFLHVTIAATPASGPPPLAVSFSGQVAGSSGGEAYQWTFGDAANSTATTKNASFTYTAEGTYSVRFRVIDSSGTRGYAHVTIPVKSAACSLSCSATVPSSGTAGTPVSFQASATASNCTGTPAYSWTFGDGQSSNAQNPSHTYAAAGTYTWTLTVTQAGASCTRSGGVTVAAAPPPGIPGDCNGDGTVSEAELQRAVNMLLGKEAPACGVDVNHDGKVTAEELQAVINAMLGIHPSGIGSLVISPASATVNAGQVQHFTVTSGEPVTWSVLEGFRGGVVTAEGDFAAPCLPGTYNVLAVSSSDPSRWGRVTVSVLDPMTTQETQTVTIGPSGGSVSLSNGLTLIVPPGAAAGATTVTFSRLAGHPLFGDASHAVLRITVTAPLSSSSLKVAIPSGSTADLIGAALLSADSLHLTRLSGTPGPTGTVAFDLGSSLGSAGSQATAQLGPLALATTGPVTALVVEYGGQTLDLPPHKLIPLPYFDQGTSKACWAAAWLTFNMSYNFDPAWNAIYELLHLEGIPKLTEASGLSSDFIAAFWSAETFRQRTEMIIGRPVEKKVWVKYESFLAYVLFRLDEGKPVMINMIDHQGVFLGYDVDMSGNVTFVYHDPADQHDITEPEPAQFPYQRITSDQLFSKYWYKNVVVKMFNYFMTYTALDPLPGPPTLQTIHMPDTNTPPSVALSTYSGMGFANGPKMVAYVYWDHIPPSGYRVDPPVVPGAATDIVLRGVPVWNMDRTAAASVNLKTTVNRIDAQGGYVSIWENKSTAQIPAFDDSAPDKAKFNYILTIPINEFRSKLKPEEPQLALLAELFDSGWSRLGHFDVVFALGPHIDTISPTSGPVGTPVTINGSGFGAPQGTSTVTFGGPVPASASSWSATQIVAAVPQGATTGNVIVTVNNTASNGVPFTLVQSVSVSVSPASVTLAPGGTQAFTATVTGTSNTAVTWGASGGSITSGGVYTAPSTPGTYIVGATSQADATKSGRATVTVSGCVPEAKYPASGTESGWGGDKIDYSVQGLAISDFTAPGGNSELGGYPTGSVVTVNFTVYGPWSIVGAWATGADVSVNGQLVESVRAPDGPYPAIWSQVMKPVTITITDEIRRNGFVVVGHVGHSNQNVADDIIVTVRGKGCQ